MPCILNAANEIAVEAYLNHQISFTGMTTLIEACMGVVPHISKPAYDDYVSTDQETRGLAAEMLKRKKFPAISGM
jgi:1-deoxy-D-xylulose-5-phosphate reductoisomerase